VTEPRIQVGRYNRNHPPTRLLTSVSSWEMASTEMYTWEDCTAKSGSGKVCVGKFVPFQYKTLGGSVDPSYAPPGPLTKPQDEIRLTHDTDQDAAIGVLKSGGFVGGHHRLRELDGKGVSISWWSVGRPSDWNNWNNFELDDRLEPGSVWDSPSKAHYMPGQDNNYRFTFRLGDLLNSYRDMCRELGMSQRITFRILGTFKYTREVMYAVLVCPEGSEQTLFEELPKAEVAGPNHLFGYRAQQPNNTVEPTWVYEPQCFAAWDKRTFSQIPGCDRKLCWDHRSFAFYIPEGRVMPLPQIQNYCQLGLSIKASEAQASKRRAEELYNQKEEEGNSSPEEERPRKKLRF